MAARSGEQFLERLAAARVHVEIQGETLTGGVADHPAFRNVVRSYADLYDMQHDPAYSGIPLRAIRSPPPSSSPRRQRTWPSAGRPPSCGPTAASACWAGPATT
jgi:hypothetical protein